MYNDAEVIFTPVQVLAMFLTKLREIISLKNPNSAADLVISVPAYYTDAQRLAVRDAAAVAGAPCLRVMNEGTAAALSYGIFKSAKKEFPEGHETRVMFLDMGYAHFTATVAAFTNGSLRIVASESDDSIGGRELDAAIARFFADEFKAKTGVDAWTDRKARLKLLVAADKAKVTITPHGVNTANASVECLKDDRDFSGTLTEQKLDELAAPAAAAMSAVIKRALAASSAAPGKDGSAAPPIATVDAGDTVVTVPSACSVDTYISPAPLGSAKRSCPLLVKDSTTLVCLALASLADLARRI